MGTLLHTVTLPVFTVVRAGAHGEVAAILSASHLNFRRALVLTGEGPTADIGRHLAEGLEAAGTVVRAEPLAGARFDEADRVKRQLVEGFFPDVLLAVGGGSVIDVVKLAAAERRLPWISVPTVASSDAFCSPIVVLDSDGEHRSLGAGMPLGVIVDLELLVTSPRRLRLAGIGDLLSNLTACFDWDRAARQGRAVVDGMARTLALGGVRQVLGIEDPDADREDVLERIVEGLLLSGVAMEVCGTSRPCSGSEHIISHQLDRMEVGHGLHGEQVGVATLFCAALQGGDVAALRRFAEGAGMIATPDGLGLDRDTFLAAARDAPEVRPGRWTTLSELAGDAGALVRAYDAAFGDPGS